VDWRLGALGGATAGIGVSPWVGVSGTLAAGLAVVLGAAGAAVLTLPSESRAAPPARTALLALVAAAIGLVAGGERLAAIDAGAFEGRDGAAVTARGIVTAVPRRDDGVVAVRVETADGRLLVQAPEPVPELPVGRQVRAAGAVAEPAPWQGAYLKRYGITRVLKADGIELTGGRRGGLAALTDRVRDRAEAALDRGMPGQEAALARGFVLGQDDRIDPATVDDFKRSGLAHLLAVSGQNVILLALLALPLLAALDLSLRARLLCVLALIAVYVPVTGAGASIQRAGVMGAAGIVAALAGRPRSRWYALLLAAFVTLAINPRASWDVGWQLSFAAVVGILLWTSPIRNLLLRRAGHSGEEGGVLSWQRALAEGAAMTIAATIATAPLMAHHFESVSITALPANLLALPAVAPVMWLGMLAAMAGQLPAVPVEPLNWLDARLIAYIAQVAHWMAAPGWAQAGLALSGPAVAAAYAGLLTGSWLARAAATRGAGLATGRRPVVAVAIVAPLAVALVAWPGPGGGESPDERRLASLEITVLDVGQGDAILLEPPGAGAVLVDGGPPGAEIAEKLDEEDVDSLAAAVVTHDELDHSAGIAELLGECPIGSLAYALAGRDLRVDARAAGSRLRQVVAGDAIRSGSLRLDVLWPSRGLVEASSDDVNASSLVLLARWRGFRMLLTGDAEAELAPVNPGPVDVLKVAHHGSEDAGLPRLLDLLRPQAAVISVGEDNTYGHPTPATLEALTEHRVPVLRTDLNGDVQIEIGASGWTARPE